VGEGDDRALASLLVAYTVAATFWLLFATAIGVLLAYVFGAPDFAPGEWLTFGRLRPIHTNATFYGWASLALVGLAYYVAARSSGTRLYSARLAWIGLILFNVAAVAGTIALDLGFNDGNLEYREWPWPIRLIFLAALVITAWNLVGTVAQRDTEDIYLSNWYTLDGVLWTCIIALVAILPWYQYGLGQVSVSGYYMHNAVGMWFTPLALGIFYYALPKPLSRPIYSYALGVFAFWTNLVFYPIIDEELPADVSLDTRGLEDGVHRLRIRAQGQSGPEGIEEIPFQVHNGPGIIVSGLSPNSTRRGKVHFTIDAFSADDPFDPRRAEARSSIPVWVWVMSLFVVAWAVWYAARMWDVPAEYAQTPTYRSQMAAPAK
jgi:hypothetical protein